MKPLLALLFWVLATQGAAASPVVADLSTYRISIDARFTGIRMFIFGARNEAGDVVIVLRGPQRDFTVRKKERILGVWANRSHLTFKDVPDFYAVASSKPLAALNAPALLDDLGIGEQRLLRSPIKPREAALYPEFSQAFLASQHVRRLYVDAPPLAFVNETLFKTTIPFPDVITRGEYTAEIYLISGGQLVGMQVLPIRVEKAGLDAFVYDLAHDYPLLYGLLAVAVALAAGWTASRLFERF